LKQDTLAELNAERAARRAVVVVTDVTSGEQRLVKAADIAADPLHAELDSHLRMGKSGMIEAGGRKLFLNVYAPTARLVIVGAVHISQASRRWRIARLRRVRGRSAHPPSPRRALSDVPLFADWPGRALPPLHIDR